MACKINNYIGLARRAGKVRTGVNVCATLKGTIPLMILCSTASENTVNDVTKLARKHNSKIIISKAQTLEELFGKENCKLACITDFSLAKAIIENVENSDNQFVLFGGNKN